VIVIGSVLPVACNGAEKDIQDAIAWGLAARGDQLAPEPYVLHSDISAMFDYYERAPESTLGAIGTQAVKQRAAILTPFVRIALAARAAADAHKPFTRADVTPEMADSLVWVAAFAHDPCPGSAGPTADRLVDIRDVVVAYVSDDRREEIFEHLRLLSPPVAATWKEPSLDRIARVLHTKVTAKGMLAAFPRDAFAAERDLILWFAPSNIPAGTASGRHYIGMRLPIRQADVSRWR
jgi:hypothetical protein